MAKQKKSIFDFTECPHCGNDAQYYQRVTYKGKGVENSTFNGSDPDNTHLYDGIVVASEGKYYYCEDCHKPICKAHPGDAIERLRRRGV